ncbi:MAG: Gfo/Idh/MocA family oxidoreductase [Candidatus Latescibacterota bacterium]
MCAQTTDPIRVGVLGQGRSGLDIHCSWLRRSPEQYRIAAVSDVLQDRRERAQTELACEAYADYQDLLARDDIDLVVNALPSHLHPQASIDALDAGHHVVCEKPLAWSVAELDRVVDAARRARRVLAPFQQSRYAPHFQKALEVLDSGVLGRIVQVSISYSGFGRRWDWQTLQEFKGGNLLNTGPHPLDQALRLLDFARPREIVCSMDRANTWGDAEDHVKILMRTPGKPDIDVEISSCAVYPRPTLVVYGTRGGLCGGPSRLDWKYFDPQQAPPQQLIRTPLPGPSYCAEELTYTEGSWEPGEEHKNSFQFMSRCFYDHLHRVLREGAPLYITPEQVRVQIAVIEECHRQNPLTQLPAHGWPEGN